MGLDENYLSGSNQADSSVQIRDPHQGHLRNRAPIKLGDHRALNLDHKPLLVFWETTKACPLSCRHCRATSIDEPLPDELDYHFATELIDQIAQFGNPSPILVMTGGDVMMRRDAFGLISYAISRGLRVALSPAVGPLLHRINAQRIFDLGVRSVSISLDGTEVTHDQVRGQSGHYLKTIATISMLQEIGLSVQVNSTVMRGTVEDLPQLAADLISLGVKIWEVFFLIQVGRGRKLLELSAQENEDVSRFLFDISQYGMLVRTVEAPLFRRVTANLREGGESESSILQAGELYNRLRSRTSVLLGEPTHRPKAPTVATRDGKGIIFVAHNGDVFPSGFLPLPLGNVRSTSLAEIYREHPLLKEIRSANFTGRCGSCRYRDLCGGSRSRAFAAYGDPLAEDPACAYQPEKSLSGQTA